MEDPHYLMLRNKSPQNSVTYNNHHNLIGFMLSQGQEFGTSSAGWFWGWKICFQSGSFL